jgi:hypothetical protein
MLGSKVVPAEITPFMKRLASGGSQGEGKSINPYRMKISAAMEFDGRDPMVAKIFSTFRFITSICDKKGHGPSDPPFAL